MRKLMCLLALPVVAGSCNAGAAGFGAVSIRPIYGWDDGCNSVEIWGHGFEEGASATIGDNPITNITQPETELEKGFELHGQAPAGAVGFSDVTVTNGEGGETDTIPRGYYYVACPAGGAFPYVEAADKTEGVVAGDTITLTGCDLQAGNFTVQVGDADPVPLTSVCGEGAASFVAPELPEGAHELTFYQGNTIVYPTVDCTPPVDTDVDTDVVDTDVDTDTDADTDVSGGDSADTGTPCDAQIVLTYGGAQ